MSYQKTNFENGDVLSADSLNKIEDAIIDLVNIEVSANKKVQSDWNENDSTQDTYIHNRPLWTVDGTLEWDGLSGEIDSDLSMYHALTLDTQPKQFLGSEIRFTARGLSYSGTIDYYITNNGELNQINNIEGNVAIGLVDMGRMQNMMAEGNYVILYAFIVSSQIQVILGAYITEKGLEAMGASNKIPGLYLFPLAISNDTSADDIYGTITYLKYSTIVIDDRYKDFFLTKPNNITMKLLSGSALNDVDFSQYNKGDILIIYTDSLEGMLG